MYEKLHFYVSAVDRTDALTKWTMCDLLIPFSRELPTSNEPVRYSPVFSPGETISNSNCVTIIRWIKENTWFR